MATTAFGLNGTRRGLVNLTHVQTDIANNRTRWAWSQQFDNAYSSVFGGGNSWSVSGVWAAGGAFNISAGTGVSTLGSGEFWLNHNTDGSHPAISLTGAISSSNQFVGSGSGTVTVAVPTIPRASKPKFYNADDDVITSFYAGSPVTIKTHRASTAFTHNITWHFGGASGTVATGLPTDMSWTPPLSMLNQIPNGTSGSGYIRTVTRSGSTTIGTYDTAFTLRAPSSVKPTISSLSASDDNPTVASVVGLYVQGLSVLKATVNAAGAYGSTITSRSFKVGSVTAASGGTIPLTSSGTVTVTASATDTRGRVGTFEGSISVLPYTPPQFASAIVRRSTSGGTLDENGTYLRVDLNCAVTSLVNSTQRNSLTIRVFTRPRGGTVWTPRNVINHSALTYNSNFVVSGGGNYPIDESFDVRVEIQDEFITSAAQTVVATSAVLMHWSKTGVGIGKFHEQGTLDVAGDIYAGGAKVSVAGHTHTGTEVTAATESARGTAEIATQSEANAGTDDTRFMTSEKVRNRSYAPYSVAAGAVSAANVSAASVVKTAVTFPSGRFTAVPRVFPSQVGTDFRDITVGAEEVTTSGFVLWRGSSYNPGIARNGVLAQWIAVQMTASNGSG
jgi:hypothetical protein